MKVRQVPIGQARLSPANGAVEEFSYIVVGAGTAGCVVAARLSQDPSARVLLLEAGGPERTRAMVIPNEWPDNLGSEADWVNVTTPQSQAGAVAYPRGRTLGGSGAINAMAHVRGHRAVYDRWAEDGAAEWGFTDLLPYFRRTERTVGRDADLRGTEGPIPVVPAAPASRHPVARAFADALCQAGFPASDDLSGGQQEGVSWTDLAVLYGERVCSADGYLLPALERPNLVVETGCLVTRLDVENARCTGVTYVRHGTADWASVTGEVIVCAGAVGSPQLLLLSGIGPAAQLRAIGIRPVADLPAVGENLQDHPIAMACYASPELLPQSAYNHGEVYAALRSPGASAWPDLHLFPILLPLAPFGYRPPTRGYALVAAVVAPDSRGSVRIASADPRQSPVIDPGFLREPNDLERLTYGLGLVRQAAADAVFAGVREQEIWPGPAVHTSAGLRSWIRHTVGSYYHPAGTCRMGSGVDAVVDTQLRVRGLAGLRVADASVMPVIPNAHPNATVLAIAERAAELISSQHGAPA